MKNDPRTSPDQDPPPSADPRRCTPVPASPPVPPSVPAGSRSSIPRTSARTPATALAAAPAGSAGPSPSGCRARAGHRPASGSSPVVPDWAGTSPAATVRECRARRSSGIGQSVRGPDRPPPPTPCWPSHAATPAAGSLSSVPPQAASLTLCLRCRAAGLGLRRWTLRVRLHRPYPVPPGSLRHLTHGPRHRHPLVHFRSFSPSLHTGSYYGSG